MICLSPKDYESLSKNMAELQRYLLQIRALVDQYERQIKAKE